MGFSSLVVQVLFEPGLKAHVPDSQFRFASIHYIACFFPSCILSFIKGRFENEMSYFGNIQCYYYITFV